MKGLKAITTIIVALLAVSILMPAVTADTVDTLSGKVSVTGGGYKTLAKIQTQNDTTDAPTYMYFFINETDSTSVGSYKVILMDESNYNNYAAGLSYTATKEWPSSSLFGKIWDFGSYTFSDKKTYYLVVDNKGSTGSLEVNYNIGVTNGKLAAVEDLFWAFVIVVIVVIVIIIVIVVLLFMKSKKKNMPPAPPMPPQPPAP